MKQLSKNNYYKQYRQYALLMLGAFILLSSCKKFTELNPLDSLSENTAFTDPSKIELVANGVYQQAAVGTYNGAAGRGYPFGAAATEQGEMRGEDMVNLQTFYQITYESTINATTANNVNHWEQLYQLINQANVLIEGVQKAGKAGIITTTVAEQYEGEGRFLRALAHHELLVHFSRPFMDGSGSKPGVPYRDFAINTPEAVTKASGIDRGTVAQDYTKILADLDWAEAHLSATNAKGAARATKGAAIALKTRIKLHMGDWPGVIAEGVKLGADAAAGPFTSPVGNYVLEASPATPFTSFNNNKESIFSIANSASSNGGVNGALPQMFGPSSTATIASAGRGLVGISPNFYNATFWVTGDKRRDLLTVQQGSSPKIYFSYKYRDYINRTDWAPIIRYAEVLLNVAEADARLGGALPLAKAFNLLNAVRNRSVPTSEQFLIPPTDLILAILNERRIELLGEGRRWADIHRLALDPAYNVGGVPAKVLPSQLNNSGSDYNLVTRPVLTPSKAAIPYSDYRFLWPIPSSETSSNPVLKAQQNPNY
jgi:starch-binding outer membrane protein, SusD/RagB family